MARILTRALLLLVCAFAALSSSAAAALGLEEERILLFSAFLLMLLLLPFLVRPSLTPPSGPLAALALLLAWILLADAASGRFDPLDARVALPVLVMLAAPNLARHFEREALALLVWRLLSGYVALTFAYQLVAEPAVVARGHEGIVRFDPTGSVIMHSSLSLIHLLLAATRLAQPQRPGQRLLTLALGAMSLAMVLLTATRTAFVTCGLFALLLAATAPRPAATVRQLALAAAGFGLAFLAWTLFVNDSFWLRLTGAQGDFSSGRWSSLGFWLALAAEHPFGLGLGAVREVLADGRPALNGTELLEWPHNEPIRFYLEAGPPGVMFVVLLLGLLVRRAALAARRETDPVRRTLLLAIAADLVAESLLQNLLNAIYHATVLVLVLSLVAATAPGPGAVRAEPGQARKPVPS
jgi:O-antigen ligase